MTISKRLLGLGASAAIVFAACGPGAPTTAPVTQAPAGRRRTTPTTAPPTTAAVKWIACVAFDTGGLGDKGFNDLAKKGLEDAKARWLHDVLQRGPGRHGLRDNIQSLIDKGCQSIVTVGFLQSQATADAAAANPDDRVRAGRHGLEPVRPDFTPATRTTRRSRRTSPASTTRSTRPRCSRATSAAGFSKTGKIGTYGGLAFPGVTRFMDGLYAGIQYYNQQKGPDRRAARLGRVAAGSDQDRHLRRRQRRQRHLEQPGQGRAVRQDLPRPGRRTSSIRSPAAPATARSRRCTTPGSGQSASTRTSTSASARRPTRRDPDLVAEGHRRLGPRLLQAELRGQPRRQGLLRHARQQRRPAGPVPRLRQPDLGRLKAEIEALKAGSSTAPSRSAPSSGAAARRPGANRPDSIDRPRPAPRAGGGLLHPSRGRIRCGSNCATSPSGSRASWPTTRSRSRPTEARCSACSARTAPARRRS